MTRQQAIKESRKRWGQRSLARAYETMSSPEKRATAAEAVRTNRERRDAIDREVQARLNALDWYQALMAERKKCSQTIRETEGLATYYKFCVGHVDIGFHVEGWGDTWEEAFAMADAKR